MLKKTKWITLTLLASSAMLFANGCLGAFWQGLWNTGFPGNGNRWLGLALDVLNEDLFG